jgi:hypothetical protein
MEKVIVSGSTGQTAAATCGLTWNLNTRVHGVKAAVIVFEIRRD